MAVLIRLRYAALSLAIVAAGALISSATSVVRPSRAATSRLTIASTPGIPSSAVAQNPTCSQAAAETG